MRLYQINDILSRLPIPFHLKLALLILLEIIYNILYLNNIERFTDTTYSKLRYKNLVCIITGANSGVGLETAKCLSIIGYEVILGIFVLKLACRNVAKAEKAAKEIRSHNKDAKLRVIKLDLCSKDSIHEFVKNFNLYYKKLDLLISLLY